MPPWHAHPLAEVGAVGGWPMLRPGQVEPVGVLIVAAPDPEAFTPDLQHLVQDVLQAGGLAWAQWRARQRTGQLLRYQQAVVRMHEALLHPPSEAAVYATLVREVVETAECAAAYVVGRGGAAEGLHLLARAARSPELAAAVDHLRPTAAVGAEAAPWDRLVSSRAWRTRRSAGPENPAMNPALRFLATVHPAWRQVQAAMAWPILGPDGQPRAVLTLLADQPEYFWRGLRQLVQQLVQHVEDALREGDRRQVLERWAWTDPLTGLANRRAGEAYLEAAWERLGEGGVVGVVMVDLDGFKQVNDRWGHAAGDALLQAVAHRLRRAVRAADCVARWGGDEFVLVCADLPAEAALTPVLRRVCRALAGPVPAPGPGQIRASLGVAFGPRHGDRPSAVLRKADLAAYQAKHRGPHGPAVAWRWAAE